MTPDPFASRLEASRGIERDPEFMRDVRLENDARALERQADHLRGMGDPMADEVEIEARRLREMGRGDKQERKAAA